MFKKFKEEVNNKVEEIKSKKEEKTMDEKKNHKGLKVALGGVVLLGTAVGSYILGNRNGKKSSDNEVEDFQDEMIEAAEECEDIESEDF